MLNYLKAEFLKYKRTPIKKLFYFVPIMVSLTVVLIMLNSPKSFMEPGAFIIATSYNWWTVLFMPLSIAFIVGLASVMERKAGNYKIFVLRNLSLKGIWMSKILTISVLMLCSVIIFSVLVAASQKVFAGWIATKEIVISTFIIWFGSISLVPIYLFFGTKFGLAGSILIGFLGSLSGPLTATEQYWFLNPFSIVIRTLCPIIKVHPNGVLLPDGDPLITTTSVTMGMISSLIFFLVLSAITSLWFEKEAVK
ncbi:ABC-2 type transport system permease protein [Fervidobacterium changbaicum]|uniref:Lantibiotic immunity ABC transporter MutE/EpiE family permease subunit n=1 Tax=Fervidobacterium changbaicum TaxID=310769 RepID=A0ABX5QSE8_9BACT|nr:lantibiotic immunity ABC transporter MutE/EpiE family permease subunit [Fervidobacterium changbaicum]QAV33350.1 lantibiotic immunity ABC transporter MutE/EpiE family permease subunit [Fervidobacterium changbaicum]SDG89407.1 ABC-2 type transport system permease protein [Fervidobacterium changbaicum]